MSRTSNFGMAMVGAAMLSLSLGACTSNEASNTMAVENAVEENLSMDMNAVENMAEENMSMDMNAVENADMAIDNADTANAIEPPYTDPQPPATDTGPDDGAEEGVGAFKDPGDMEVDNWYNVEFFVAPDAPQTTAAEDLADVSEGVELTAAQQVYVAPIMRVTMLPDPNFEIRQKGDAIRTTGRDRSASWQWDVKPLTGGDRTLFAKVEVLKRLPNGSFETTETKTRRVAFSVKVGTWKGLMIGLRNAAGMGDLLATLFSSWRGALVALVALIGAASAVWLAIRNFGKAKPQE